MRVIRNSKMAMAPGLVRPAIVGDWVIADNDMNATFVWHEGWSEFRPLAQALWLAGNKQRTRIPGVLMYSALASRSFLGTGVLCANGDAIFQGKWGVKELEDAYKAKQPGGVDFDDTDWGMYLIRLSPDDTVIWKGRYPIHKGAAQLVPGDNSNEVKLIASTGICWVIDMASGAVLKKTKVVMGPSGEKSYATTSATSYIGYTNNPSGMARLGIDERSIPVCSKPPYELGDDMIRCAHIASELQPKALWWAMLFGGQILFNVVGPNMRGKAKFPVDKLPSAGPATKEPRHFPALFQIPGSNKVGIAVKDDGQINVQVLAKKNVGRVRVGPGAWPAAVTEGGVTRVVYFNGNALWQAQIGH